MVIKKNILPNQIKVISEEIKTVRSVALGLWILVGSKEDEKFPGLSHFIEHMLFKGTKNRSASQIAECLDEVGGELNAFTTKEYICLYARVLDEHLPRALELLADIFLYSLFAEEEIEKEKKVVIEEINMYEDRPEDVIHDLFDQIVLKNKGLAQSTLGKKEAIVSFARQEIIEFIQKKYQPAKLLLTVSGNLNSDFLIEFVERTFSPLENSPSPTLSPEELREGKIFLKDKDLEQAHLCLGFRAYPYSHPQRYTLNVINTILGGGMSSRLFQQIREKEGLAYSIYSFLEAYQTTGVWGIYAGTSPKNLPRLIDLIWQQIRKIKKEGVSPSELEKAKEQIKGQLMLSLESMSVRMQRLAASEMYFHRQFTLDEVIAKINRVSLDDVLKVAEDLIREENFGLCALGPQVSELKQKDNLNLNL